MAIMKRTKKNMDNNSIRNTIFFVALMIMVMISARMKNNLDISIQSSSSILDVNCQQQDTESKTGIELHKQQDFSSVALKTGTDKVAGYAQLPLCLENEKQCVRPDCEREKCRPWGHFYDTMYNRWLGKYSTVDATPIQFLEIGFFKGKGFEAYTNYLPNAELHSMEIDCTREGGKVPASNHRHFSKLLEDERLHCGDASDYEFLNKIWTTKMKREDAPPLMVVVDDGSHLASHMAKSLFFWFPRIEPGGILVVEDVQPEPQINKFRTHILPQVMKDLHWCGRDSTLKDTRCFPTIQPLLQGVHCEMHICVFVRNDEPSSEPDIEHAKLVAEDAFKNAETCLFGPH